MSAGPHTGMSDGLGGQPSDGFDAVVSESWHRFEGNLAAHVASMPEGSYITITSAQASHGQRGQRPYVDLVALKGEQMVCVAALPSYLYPNNSDHVESDRRLHGLGWSEPGKPTGDGTVMDYTMEGSKDESDLLATVAVATFREVWNVPHPSFLSAWTVGPSDAAGGPAALQHIPFEEPDAPPHVSSIPSAESLPTSLRSLHTFCELVGSRVDSATVASVCGSENLAVLRELAWTHARRCSAHADRCQAEGSLTAARVWRRQARSWQHTADSLGIGGDSRQSGPDSAAKSAGS